jgi:long-chain acyl-CoA synthetase
MNQCTRTFDLLELYATKYKDKEIAIAGKENKKWVNYSSKEYVENSFNASYGLLALGLNKGDKVATITNNRPEWNFLDMGLAQAGIIHVPLFTNLSPEGYAAIFNHAEVKAVFVANKALHQTIQSILDTAKTVVNVFTFDEVDGARNWKEVLELGKQKESDFKETISQNIIATQPTDPVTLIYTSGTTGNSKGVLLSHQNLVTNAIACANVFKLQSDQRYLSILPICHVGERMANYQTQYSGCSIYYSENLATIANDLSEIKPHGFGAVPRILERVYDKIMSKGHKLTGIKKKLFFWSLNLGLRYDLNNGVGYKIKLGIARKLVFSKWREAMGSNVVSIGVGGAALQPRLEKVFWAAGIKLLNMYGLTETSPVITINRQDGPELKIGTVGAVINDVEVKIAEDGEILCKGPNVMLGYYKDEKATEDAFTEGWFRTGDIGVYEDGFLRITDRKKEIFKLSNGKYVSPQAIENIFKESVYIDQLIVIGEGEKFTSALISPNFEALKDWCTSKGIATGSEEDIIGDKEVKQLYQKVVKEFNARVGEDEQVKRFRLVKDEWTPLTGELSPTLKLKRRVLGEKYKPIINSIFGHKFEDEKA